MQYVPSYIYNFLDENKYYLTLNRKGGKFSYTIDTNNTSFESEESYETRNEAEFKGQEVILKLMEKDLNGA
jgi:hypothetical protein